ncbi:complex I subunit 5 family protein [Psychromonas sp.]|uniref:complex I subunit 5 family protein n=1 Tax=Psychromonas sp. TaxID=1884585 RepID=UPI0035673A55
MNMMPSGGLLLLAVGWPLFLTLLLVFKRIRPVVLHLASWAALPALLASLLVAPSGMRWHLPWMMLGSELGLDTIGQMFLLPAALLWTVSGRYARAYFLKQEQRTRFYLFFLPAMGGNFALILAQELQGFYLGFTLMSFASYGLVIFNGTTAALLAGRVYIGFVVAGEVMLFASLILATYATGSTTFDVVRIGLIDADNREIVILLALAGFAIKVGVFGLHVWLPLAHPVAPAPASAVLSGAMLKAGLLGWLRLLPLGEVALPEWGGVIIVAGLTSAFYGVVIGVMQRDPKILLAYSSISQMGIITMTMGLGMLAPQAWPNILPGIAFYALHHGLSKGALFLGVGIAGSQDRLQRRWIWFALWLPALALAGAPWTSGMLVKHLVKAYTFYAPTPWNTLLLMLLLASTVATSLLMVRLLYLLRPSANPMGLAPAAGLVWPWVVLLLTILFAPWWLRPSSVQAGYMQALESLWPILLAYFVAMVVLRMGWFLSVQPVSADDLQLFLTRSVKSLCRMGINWAGIRYTVSEVQRRNRVRLINMVAVVMARIKWAEDYIACWDVAIFLVVVMILGMGLMA